MKPSARPMITRDDMRGDPVDQLHPLIRACEQVGDGCLRVGLHRIGLRERGLGLMQAYQVRLSAYPKQIDRSRHCGIYEALRAGVDVVCEAGFLRPPKAN